MQPRWRSSAADWPGWRRPLPWQPPAVASNCSRRAARWAAAPRRFAIRPAANWSITASTSAWAAAPTWPTSAAAPALDDFFRRDRTLTFIGPDGADCIDLQAARWLPAPLHLAPGFLATAVSLAGRPAANCAAMWKLMRMRVADDPQGPTVGAWLAANGQSAAAIERFWNVILVSALGEQLDRASLAAARKVIVDGFLAAREAYEVDVPEAPLGALYGERLERWFAEHHVAGAPRRCGSTRRRVASCRGWCCRRPAKCHQISSSSQCPGRKSATSLDPSMAARWPWLDEFVAWNRRRSRRSTCGSIGRSWRCPTPCSSGG